MTIKLNARARKNVEQWIEAWAMLGGHRQDAADLTMLLKAHDAAATLEAKVERMRPMLRSAMCLLHGLRCIECGLQGRAMADGCSRDVDCFVGWAGIGADEVRDWLQAAEELMPGALAEIEHPADPINEAAILKATGGA